ncbi:hypothetical protein BANRA_04678 [Klebsiella pneumoniae]|nr:hypothetical protein BANRA_04678 [Klebsiella pneumoniae]
MLKAIVGIFKYTWIYLAIFCISLIIIHHLILIMCITILLTIALFSYQFLEWFLLLWEFG